MKCPNCGHCFNAKNTYSNLDAGPDYYLPVGYQHIMFRSGYEKTVARWLILNNHLNFEYEQKRFKFPKEEIKDGPKSYLPDFYIPQLNVYIEVKGHLSNIDKERHRRFKKYYPGERLWAVISKKNKDARLFYEILAERTFFIEDLK